MKPATIKRIAISMLLGVLIAAISTEVSYQVLKRENREPQQIELIIPANTAQKVAVGQAPPNLPEDMTFVVGDTLVVVNQDSVDHQLGPLWIPPASSASLNLETEQNFILDCSFQPSKVFGIDVLQPVTLGTRLTGILFAGFPLGALFAVYSVLITPDKEGCRWVILRTMFSRQWILTTLLVLVGGGVCVRLGIWQLDRLDQRRTFNSHVEAMWAVEPLSLPDTSASDLGEMEYRAVTVTGTYDFKNQVALRNRYYHDVYGYNLLTPLLLNDGSAVLVDRGWIPADGNDSPADWRKYDLEGRISISGQIRLGASKPDLGGVPDPTLVPGQERLEFWNIVNLERIGRQLPYPLMDVFVQPDPVPGRDDPPVAYQPEIELTEGPHLGYAGQWFTFASILVLGYPFYLRKQLNQPKELSNSQEPPGEIL